MEEEVSADAHAILIARAFERDIPRCQSYRDTWMRDLTNKNKMTRWLTFDVIKSDSEVWSKFI
jgi:uncharacterized protein YeaO (DUF488 family)